MSDKNKLRIEQLMQYAKLLEGMQRSGFNCKSEMKQTMSELHELMLPRKEKLNVVVLERGLHVQKTTKFYADLLGVNAVIRPDYSYDGEYGRNATGHIEVRNDNVNIYIVNEDYTVREYFLPDEKNVSHLINNTNDFHLPQALGYKAV